MKSFLYISWGCCCCLLSFRKWGGRFGAAFQCWFFCLSVCTVSKWNAECLRSTKSFLFVWNKPEAPKRKLLITSNLWHNVHNSLMMLCSCSKHTTATDWPVLSENMLRLWRQSQVTLRPTLDWRRPLMRLTSPEHTKYELALRVWDYCNLHHFDSYSIV